jgi:signal transduction histidine kinase
VAKPDYTHRLERLLEISRKLNTSLVLESLLQTITEAASELVGCEDSSILTVDEETKSLHFIAGPWFELDLMKPFRVPLDNSVAGWVFTHAQPVVLQDASQDQRVFRAVDQALNFETGSIMAVPMIFKDQVIGVLEAVNKKGNLSYINEDILILETLASQAAVALQNARLLEKTTEAYEQMIELDRMKTDFIAITSHELRTPLGLILGHATFLREMASDEQASQMDVILRSAMRLKEIVEEFSNVDNFKIGMARVHLRPTNIPHFIQEVVETFQDVARQKGVTLGYDISRADLTVELDPEKIGVALNNLIKNALTYTNSEGHVLVKAEAVRNNLWVSVSDDGIGIPAKDIKKIFERFYQVESHLTRRHGGMGLGLSIARSMVEMHDGRIWAESVEGHGSRLTFVLPIKR